MFNTSFNYDKNPKVNLTASSLLSGDIVGKIINQDSCHLKYLNHQRPATCTTCHDV